jgi:two-component sensor histidine kinase
LEKKLPNQNQRYKVTLEQVNVLSNAGSLTYGYDSRYPNFEENKKEPGIKNQFNLEVTPTGNILRFYPSINNKSITVALTSINSSHNDIGGLILYSQLEDREYVKNVSTILFQQDSAFHGALLSLPNQVPLMIDQPKMIFQLTNASFPLADNAIVQGRLTDQLNQDIKISMIGRFADYYFPAKQFSTNSDGSFNCPFFINRPLHLRIQIGNKTLTTFMEPGDTLNISAIGHQAKEIENNQYADTKPNGYFLTGTNKSDYFSGNAAYNTMLSNVLDQYRTGIVYETDTSSFLLKYKRKTEFISQLIESYRGKASEECIRYFENDMNYFSATAKLLFREKQLTPNSTFSIEKSQNSFNIRIKDNKVGRDYPADFYLEVDTLPVLKNPYTWNSSYQDFLQKSYEFKQNRTGWSLGKNRSNDFLENYYYSKATLSGYPLYLQLAKLIKSELRNSFSDFSLVIPYYQSFLNNCQDPVLTESLKKVYETAQTLKIGNRFPVNSFELKDSSVFDLEKYKGKPVCLIFMDDATSHISKYNDEVSKFKGEEAVFIIAQLRTQDWKEEKMDSAILKLPNVTFIELTDKSLIEKLLLKRYKIFMLDKWFRIVENDAQDPAFFLHRKNDISRFEQSLRKTINRNRFFNMDFRTIVKTTWRSFVILLIGTLMILWANRMRIREIKKQEAAKRRIKELEIKAVRSQMNPHFIFNALNSIQSLINGNHFKEANIYLSKFAVLLRGVLHNSEKVTVTLSDELQAVELYCQLEQLRFEFKFEINIDPQVNADIIEIPGMIIQPLVENAIVHGLSPKGSDGRLTIGVERQNGNLCVCVTDNGVGMNPQKTDVLSQKGFGLKLVEERINILNLDGKEAKLRVENRIDATGTMATLIIPID